MTWFFSRVVLAPAGAVALAGVATVSGCASGGASNNNDYIGTGGAIVTSSTGIGGAAASGGDGGGDASVTSVTTGQGGGGADPGLGLGAECAQDADCESLLCKMVLLNTDIKVCVTECTEQAECGDTGWYFCEPISAGSTDGYCIPRSPAHCLSCSENSDCGSLSEECLVADGDEDSACHVDCSIAGEDACPPEYTCEQFDVEGTMRSLCRPDVPTCLDALGGYCERVKTPQSCMRENDSGSCLGQRDCLSPSDRYDSCDADAPQCKSDCEDQDPAGCNLIFCASATEGVDNCGSCGFVCPGVGQEATANISCDGTDCGFSCQGNQYDVDDSEANGCEQLDPFTNHTKGSASYLGSFPCSDGASGQDFGSTLMSDARVHELPAVTGFDAAIGAAPDWWRLFADGGLCFNDYSMTLDASQATFKNCYGLQFITNNVNETCTTNANGFCSMSGGTGSYSDDTDIHFRIFKTCSTNMTEAAPYTVTGHL